MKARKHLRGFDSNIEEIAVLRLCGWIDKDVLDSLRDAIRREKDQSPSISPSSRSWIVRR